MLKKIIELEPILQNLRRIEINSNNIDKIVDFLKTVPKENLDKYILMPRAESYAWGVHVLRKVCQIENNSVHPLFTQDDGSKIYRPLTIKETIEAKVNDYESNKSTDERLRLFNRRIDSCTGIAYKAETTKFKIISMCKELITTDVNFDKELIRLDIKFDQSFPPVDYDSLPGVEFDSSKRYNRPLMQAEVIEDSTWRAVVEDDLNLLRAYRDIVFAGITPNTHDNQKRGLCFDCAETYGDFEVVINKRTELMDLYLDGLSNVSSYHTEHYDDDYHVSFLKLVSSLEET